MGKSSMRGMPWEGSGRYSPGPGMVKLLEKWFYQELRPLMAICSLNPPGNLAIISNFFGLSVCGQSIDRFKPVMAFYYRACYKTLFDKILSGEVLHVDETEVRLRTGKGYVWVFTTSEEVIYMFRPTREGDFLLDLLKNFPDPTGLQVLKKCRVSGRRHFCHPTSF